MLAKGSNTRNTDGRLDLSFVPEIPATHDAINNAIRKAAEGELAGVLAYEEDPLVSVDFNHDPHSSCFAAAQTSATADALVQFISWYDNEWGLSNQMIDTGRRMGALLHHSTPLKMTG